MGLQALKRDQKFYFSSMALELLQFRHKLIVVLKCKFIATEHGQASIESDIFHCVTLDCRQFASTFIQLGWSLELSFRPSWCEQLFFDADLTIVITVNCKHPFRGG